MQSPDRALRCLSLFIFQDSFGFYVFRRGVANALLGQGSATETIRHGLGHAPGSHQFEAAYRSNTLSVDTRAAVLETSSSGQHVALVKVSSCPIFTIWPSWLKQPVPFLYSASQASWSTLKPLPALASCQLRTCRQSAPRKNCTRLGPDSLLLTARWRRRSSVES